MPCARHRPAHRRYHRWLATCLTLTSAFAGCDEPEPSYNLGGLFAPDASSLDSKDMSEETLEPLSGPEDICTPGETRCRANQTPFIEICGVAEGTDAARWYPDICTTGELCNDNICGPFACTPGRQTCAGLNARGVCAEDGRDLLDVKVCDAPQVCRGGRCVDLCETARESRSYIGCDYLLTQLPNSLLDQAEPLGLVVSNPSPLHNVQLSLKDHKGNPAQIVTRRTITPTYTRFGDSVTTIESTITRVDGASEPITDNTVTDLVLPAGGVATLLLPYNPIPSDGIGVYDKTVRLSSTRPVVAYQFNPYCCNFSFTNDATILLPTNTLGTQYTATLPPDWIISRATPAATLKGGLTLLADRDTQLQITIPAGARIDAASPSSLVALSPPAPMETESLWSVPLKQGQALYLQSGSTAISRSDLTGIQVKGDQPFAAFSSHNCTNIPHSLPACDHIETQLIPDNTWGRTFLLPTLAKRSNAFTEVFYWHIIAQNNDTEIRFDPALDFSTTLSPFSPASNDCHDVLASTGNVWTLKLSAGDDCIFGARAPFRLTATAPISVIGYLVSESAANSNCGGSPFCSTGDPSMFLVPPAEQLRKTYAFLTPATYAYDFATIVIPTQAVSSVTLDGLPLDLRREEIITEPMGGGYTIAHIPISDGAHRIEASAPFELIVYAYDRFVSYAFAGGLNLTKRPNNAP